MRKHTSEPLDHQPSRRQASQDAPSTPSEAAREPLSAERWRRVSGVVEVALELDPATRALYLEAMGRNDEDLRRRVMRILRSMNAVDGDAEPRPVVEQADRMGPWRIVRLLGRGGMGAVFLAERDDDEFERQVAVKVIGDGFQTPSVYRRFLAERQILAAFDHPNIGKLFDGGTAGDGRPYLVMEYVDGEPIDSYCFDRELSLTRRLKLFRKVCSAVAYAHRQLVVHRDLKPTNILVGQDGEPKLLDFGIAKLLEPGALLPFELEATRHTQAVMTPSWASPEQLRREPITTSSDVYSLGLILFKLLTGTLPWRDSVTRDEESSRVTTRPSRLLEDEIEESPEAWPQAKRRQAVRLLRGDLDNIVMKALRPEPEKRYPSVEAFDEDIERYLEGLPVSATRDTPLYHLRKIALRYRWQVIAAVVFMLGTLSTAGVAIWQAQKVSQQRDRAEQQARQAELQAGRAEGSLRFLGELLRAADRTEREQEELSVSDLLGEGLERLERDTSLAPEAKVDLLDLIASAFIDFHDFPATVRALELALDNADRSDVSQARRTELLARLAHIRIMAGDTEGIRGTCERLLSTTSVDSSWEVRLTCLSALTYAAWFDGDLQEVVMIRRRLLLEASAVNPPTASALNALARWAELSGFGVVAPEYAVAFLADVNRLALHELPPEQARQVWSEGVLLQALELLKVGDLETATRIESWLSEQPTSSHAHDTSSANMQVYRLRLRMAQGRYEEALELSRQVDAMAANMLDLNPDDLRARYLIAEAPRRRAEIWQLAGDERRRREDLQASYRLYRELYEDHGDNFFVRRAYTSVLLQMGDPAAAPLVQELLEAGYRHGKFLDLAAAQGLLPEKLPPEVKVETSLPPSLAARFAAARHAVLPWEQERAESLLALGEDAREGEEASGE